MNEVNGETNNHAHPSENEFKETRKGIQPEMVDKIINITDLPPDPDQTEIVRNEIGNLGPRTSSAKLVEQQNSNSGQKPTLKPFERLRNNLSYPSLPLLRKLRFVPLGADLSAATAIFTGIPLEFSIPVFAGAAVANAGYFAERYRFSKATIKINDLMKVCRVASPRNKVFEDRSIVDKGEIVGELHMEGGNVRKEWKEMSPVERGRAMTEEGINSLMSLAQLCKTNNESVTGMAAFYGISDIIQPDSMKRIGFEVESVGSNPLTKLELKMKRIRALGIMGGLRAPVGKFYEAWITRGALVASIPNLEHYQRALSRQ